MRRSAPARPAPAPSRSDRGHRRLRALVRLAIRERPVTMVRVVEPCARAARRAAAAAEAAAGAR